MPQSEAETSRARELQELIDSTWDAVVADFEADPEVAYIDDLAVAARIRQVVNSKTKSYHYVLPTQVGAKVVDASLDARCCQAQRGGRGAFDARSLCTKAVVPFDKTHDNVLGGSGDPYVNKPLRYPEVTSEFRQSQLNKDDWDALCAVLEAVEEWDAAELTAAVFRQTMLEIRLRLQEVGVRYPVPLRLPLDTTQKLVEEYLSNDSGGVRLQATATALFWALGDKYGFSVLSSGPTTADTPSGRIADIECQDEQERTFLAIEVKDRSLTVVEAESTLSRAREQSVSEILVIAQNGVSSAESNEMSVLVSEEFAKGQNLYVFPDAVEFIGPLLVIVGEDGRSRFLQGVGQYLDEYALPYDHRKCWGKLLSEA